MTSANRVRRLISEKPAKFSMLSLKYITKVGLL
nr:MAG TPA_asm: hypothetical protein [Caudoviricetes sp.]DAQ34262.1 MAG TPA: hypothetical protein [Caudoviricetes sp.]